MERKGRSALVSHDPRLVKFRKRSEETRNTSVLRSVNRNVGRDVYNVSMNVYVRGK